MSIILSAITLGSATAFAGITTSPTTLNAMLKTSGNYAWLGNATGQYNCLAYVLDNYSSWIWPWSGPNNPTASDVNIYLRQKGFGYGEPMGSYYGDFSIISYGTESSIGHFGRIADTVNGVQYSNAKWGKLERLQHVGWSPYKSSSTYGDAYQKYARK